MKIPIRMTVQISDRITFRIPLFWRMKMNMMQGNVAIFHIQNNSIIIHVCNQYTTAITSTISEGGQIYIPTEVRNHFQLKGIECFNVYIDEFNKYVILKPLHSST